MPIYEYRCTGCNRKFEQIVLRGKALDEASCPRCGSRDVEKILSPFAMSGVSRKSEESFDDDFDAPDDDYAGGFGDEELGDEDDLGPGTGADEDEGSEGEEELNEDLGSDLDDEDDL